MNNFERWIADGWWYLGEWIRSKRHKKYTPNVESVRELLFDNSRLNTELFDYILEQRSLKRCDCCSGAGFVDSEGKNLIPIEKEPILK